MENKRIFLFFVVLFVSGFLAVEVARAEGDGKSEFAYSQKKLNQVKEKNMKYKVVIGSFEDSVGISGSPFNKAAKEVDAGSKTYNINIATPNLVKPGEVDVNNVIGMLSDLLKKTDKFDVVERKEVNQLIREIQFEGADWVKKEPANKLGNIYGVQFILLGEILPNYGGEQIGPAQYTATLRLVDVATGVVVSTGMGQKNYLQKALDDAVHILVDDMEGDRWFCRVVRVDEKGIYINAGLDDKIEKNDVFAVVRFEDKIVDKETGYVLGKKQTEIAKIKIINVLEKNLSLAKSLNEGAPIKEGDVVSAKRVILEKNSETHLWKKIFKHTSDQE